MKKFAFLGLLALTPVFVLAQTFDEGVRFTNYVDPFIEFLNFTVVPLVFALAFVFFIWGAVTYFIRGGADETKREEGRNLMLYGIIGFVLMVSVWGIVNFVAQGIGFGGEEDVADIPNVPITNPR